ncbi:hypothetical protein N7G274_010670 [Stereocaulon virgatum]|uniref:Uncharacterized protein n=1 Tax=Stereocaulon virgatum TaxID=373712 RepID=A0ABR3ZVM0_9LECA
MPTLAIQRKMSELQFSASPLRKRSCTTGELRDDEERWKRAADEIHQSFSKHCMHMHTHSTYYDSAVPPPTELSSALNLPRIAIDESASLDDEGTMGRAREEMEKVKEKRKRRFRGDTRERDARRAGSLLLLLYTFHENWS